MCITNRIPGAKEIGYVWIVPEDAEKPVDARIKSGKYLKNKKDSAMRDDDKV